MYANNIQFTKVEIQLIKHIFKHYKEEYNARQLAKTLSLNHAHINKLCSGLVDKKLLLKKEMGNSTYYSFNYGDELAMKFIEYLISLELDEIPPWLKVLAYNLKKFNEHIILGCVFGSAITADTYNDIDILIVYDQKKKPAVNNVKNEIRTAGLVEKPIRYVEMTEKDLQKNKDDAIFYSIMSENIVFHNPAKYVEVIKCLR